MGILSNEISGLIKSMKGLDLTKQNIFQWFKKTSDSIGDKSIVKTSGIFQPGKIYIFRYETPVTEGLESWDLNPVVLSLGTHDGKDIGINLNLMPQTIKVSLMDKIRTVYGNRIDAIIKAGGGNALSESSIPELNYNTVKGFLESSGFGGSIRTYHTNLRKNTRVVSYADWNKVALLDVVQIKGDTINKVHGKFIKSAKKKKE